MFKHYLISNNTSATILQLLILKLYHRITIFYFYFLLITWIKYLLLYAEYFLHEDDLKFILFC